MTEPELAFLHIPKAAGTSLHQSFNRNYGRDQVFWFGDHCPPETAEWPGDLIGSSLVVGGHKPLNFYPQPLNPLFCAVLRNPVERAISLFTYYTRPNLARLPAERDERAALLERKLEAGIDPDSLLNSIEQCQSFRLEISNNQCAYLSRKRARFEDVLASLKGKDFLLGTLDGYEDYHRYLGDLLGWPPLASRRLNQSADNYAETFLSDPELVARLEEMNREDFRLLEYVSSQPGGMLVNIADLPARKKRLERMVTIDPGPEAKNEAWMNEAGQYWPRGEGCKLPFPLCDVVAPGNLKLFYSPIPGAANSRVMNMLVNRSGLSHREQVKKLGARRVLGEFNTGIMLKDRSLHMAKAIMWDESWFRFAVMVEPLQRLLDVYLEKFLRRRLRTASMAYARPCLEAVQGTSVPDFDLGVSFRQFVDYTLRVSPRLQGVECLPQHLFLRGVDAYHRLYRSDQLALLQADLRELRGLKVSLVGKASSDELQTSAAVPEAGSAADLLPGQLEGIGELALEALVDDSLRAQVRAHYAEDYALYEGITEASITHE